MKQPVALAIAGSDSGGGAGIQADLKTFSAFGVHGTTAITAVTAQNTFAVRSIEILSAEVVAQQIDAVLEDFKVGALKVGMLGNLAVAEVLVDRLRTAKLENVVVDPVFSATSGEILLEQDALSFFREDLLPLSTVVTPNTFEAARLLDITEQEIIDSPEQATAEICSIGANAVVITGGHLPGNDCVDYFYDGDRLRKFSSNKIQTKNTHGSGCTYSSAIAAELARGTSLKRAVASAKEFIHQAIVRSSHLSVGRGRGPVGQSSQVSSFRL